MKRLLRGIIDWGGLPPESLAGNFQKLGASNLNWLQPADARIHKFVKDFFSRELNLPSGRILVDFFTRTDDIEVVERLKGIKDADAYEGSNYSFVLKGLLEDQHRQTLLTVLKETQEVAQRGLVIGEGKKKTRIEGVKEAVLYFQKKSVELLTADSNAKTRGNIRESTEEAWADYLAAEANPGKSLGSVMGLLTIDEACRGLKGGELWLHAAYTGELKTVWGLNWSYHAVTRYKKNVFFVSLEMPYVQLRNIICVLHSSHLKWKVQGYAPLDYRKVRDGKLDQEEKAFYRMVLEDFDTCPDYCQFEVWCPDHEVNMNDVKMEAELLHKQMILGLIVVDHGGIAQPIEKYSDFNIALNTVIRDAKRMALHFNQGQGIPVLLLFQINRQGKDDADKNDGRYKLKALSHANEAERSADVVTTTYLNDDLRKDGKTRVCNLKNRDNPLFEPMLVGVDFTCRRLFEVEQGAGMTSGPDETEADLNRMSELV